MHIRNATVKRNGKTFKHPQLVESYRRKKDGMPAHRVIAGLSSLSEQELENLRIALAASREGRRVVMLPDKARKGARTPRTVRRNLRYLAEAVLWEIWRDSSAAEILREMLPDGGKLVPAADVIGILVCQRCVAPASKLYAQEWFPKTALPELIGIVPARFNNTRIHRVLEHLDGVDEEVQKRLASVHSVQRGAFGAMFIDVTDTWFEGRGPDLADAGKTKEGLHRRKISIVLLCDERGYPLRWKVIRGRTADSKAMLSIADEIHELDWARQAPLVFDRAMGKTAYVRTLLDAGLRFVTALTREEFDSYTTKIPYSHMQQLKPLCTKASREDDIRLAAKAAQDAGMEEVLKNLFVLDLGVIERRNGEEASVMRARPNEMTSDKTVVAMECAQEMYEMLSDGRAGNRREAGAEFGYGSRYVGKLLNLLKLAEDIQQAVLDGEAAGLSLQQLFDVASLCTPEMQHGEFQRLLFEASERPDSRRSLMPSTKRAALPSSAKDPLCVRAVVAFNPEMFVTQRRHAEEELADIRTFVRGLNRRLKAPQSRRSKTSVIGEVATKLRRASLTEIFSVEVETRQVDGRKRFFVKLDLCQDKWERRRRYDGFSLLVAHPDLLDTAAELCQLYRAKDMVEKDIQTIKSVFKLRPVRHRSDPKVRAHVSLCMLGLRINRRLEEGLAQALPRPMTASAAFETLRDVCLNQLQPDGESTAVLTITDCSREQLKILDALGLGHLADDDQMIDRFTPR